MMPNMNGYELLQTLRSNITTQSIPIILLSAKAGEDASIEGIFFLHEYMHIYKYIHSYI